MAAGQCSSIQLRKLFLHEESPGRFSVIRWGGTARIQTNVPGVEAIRCMVRGLTLEQTRRELGERYQKSAAGVDLSSLLEKLSRADLIASIDGQRIPSRRPVTLGSLFKFLFRFHIKPTSLRVFRGCLPFSRMRQLCFVLTRIDWSSAIENKTDQALDIVRQLPRWPNRSQSPAQFRRSYRREFIWKMAEVQALVSSPAETIDRWMEKHVRLDGREHLDAALSLGQGVLLCPFRFGCPGLIPMTLIRAGYSLTQITAPGGLLYANEFSKFQKLCSSFGSYREVQDLSLGRYRTVLSDLESGRLVVWLPDYLGSDESPDIQNETRRSEGFPGLKTVLPKARISVPFFGANIFMNRWVGGFAVMTGSPVIPAAFVRMGRNIHFQLEPPILPEKLPGGAAQRAEAINRVLFAGLERFVQRYPAQWLAWRHVHFAQVPGAEDGPAQLVCA